jgi:hypothetical protein
MQLEAIPVPSVAAQTQQLDIHLSLNFNEHWEPLLGGRVKFGLQGGTLKLYLENCEIPVASRQLVGCFKLLPIEETLPIKSSAENLVSESQRGVQGGEKAEKIKETESIFCHVSTISDDTTPAWIFAVEQGKSVLKGLLKSAKLGELAAETISDGSGFSSC